MTRQRGAALIMVLGIMAIITVLATQVMDTVRQQTQQHSASRDLRQGYWYAKGGETYALSKLADFIDKPLLEKEDLEVAFPIDGGGVRYRLQPMHTCLNINSLNQNKEANEALYQFTTNVWKQFLEQEIKLSAASQEMLIDRIRDWTDKDTLPEGGYGAETPFYSGQTPPQAAADDDMVSVSELLQLEALSNEEAALLLPYVCTRPGDQTLALNVNDLNTSSAPLISALIKGAIDSVQIAAIINDRPKEGYAHAADFWQHPIFNSITLSDQTKAALVNKRHYFQLETEVRLGSVEFSLTSWLYINDEKNARVLGRRYGVAP